MSADARGIERRDFLKRAGVAGLGVAYLAAIRMEAMKYWSRTYAPGWAPTV